MWKAKLGQFVRLDQRQMDQDGGEAVVVRLGEEAVRRRLDQHLAGVQVRGADGPNVAALYPRLLGREPFFPGPGEAFAQHLEGAAGGAASDLGQRAGEAVEVIFRGHGPTVERPALLVLTAYSLLSD